MDCSNRYSNAPRTVANPVARRHPALARGWAGLGWAGLGFSVGDRVMALLGQAGDAMTELVLVPLNTSGMG
jgi:hypothetical protein